MELPEHITAIGEQVEAGGAITPDLELFETYEVFAAELTHLFVKPWLAADHASRLASDGDYFRVDIGGRSVVIAREAEDKIHAMRNACLHAGYRICEEEEGRGDHLFCRYHGWDYAIDGRLTDPELRPEETDRSRFRLPRYAMQIWKGLIFIDPSLAAPNAPEAKPIEAAEFPDLGDAKVVSRKRFQTTWNWKPLRQFLWSSNDLIFEGGSDTAAEFGPLSKLLTKNGEGALLRLIPRYAGHSDFEIVRIAQPGYDPAAGGESRIEEALRVEGERIAGKPEGSLGRDFYAWYWAAMKPATADA
ncbi:MAG TPA: Rieske 2Fe-2S domain-containing protein [Stellaceae bacterium]|nr:Rieske 2Fe-2S domain-containing protein [Stellaceae bacterium]